jgi:hypothetical protein
VIVVLSAVTVVLSAVLLAGGPPDAAPARAAAWMANLRMGRRKNIR